MQQHLSGMAVDGFRHVSKVSDRVVCPVSVSVIDVAIRPFPVNVEPRKSMCHVVRAIDLYPQISVLAQASSGSVGSSPAAKPNNPREDSGLFVVPNARQDVLLCKHAVSP